jgi:hypothetical protein
LTFVFVHATAPRATVTPATDASPINQSSISALFLKLFERVYAPLTAARLRPVPGDAALPPRKHPLLDRLYQRFNAALDRLLHAVPLPPTPTSNENKILVDAPHKRLSCCEPSLHRGWAQSAR